MATRKARPPALAELYERDQEAGIDPLAFDNPPPQPHPQPAESWTIPRADWDQEQREREARERAEHDAYIRQAAAELEPAEPPARPTAPATPKRWRKNEAAA